jgi:hypothetical protein
MTTLFSTCTKCNAQNALGLETCQGCLNALLGNQVLETQAQYIARTQQRLAAQQTCSTSVHASTISAQEPKQTPRKKRGGAHTRPEFINWHSFGQPRKHCSKTKIYTGYYAKCNSPVSASWWQRKRVCCYSQFVTYHCTIGYYSK